MSWKATSANLLFQSILKIFLALLTVVLLPVSKKKTYEIIQSINSTRSLPKHVKLERGSPFAGLLVVYCCLALAAEDRLALVLILLIALSNFVLLLWRLTSIGTYAGRIFPSHKDILSYLYLIVAAFPFRAICLAVALAITFVAQKIVTALSIDQLNVPWPLPWALSFWSTKGFPLTGELVIHVICGRLLLLAWNVTCTETFSKKYRYIYGSPLAAILLPTVNGMGYLCTMFFHWTLVLRVLNFLLPTFFPLVSGTIFYVVHQLLSALFFDAGFFRMHSTYHSPEYFGVVHWNHHLSNFPDWVDGLGEGPEEALLTFPTFQSWLPPSFFPVSLWVFFASVFDGSVHAYEAPVMIGEQGFSEDFLGFYDGPMLMHVHHHLSITNNLASPLGEDLYEEERKHNKFISDQIGNMSLTGEPLRKRWLQKMGFIV